MLEPKKSKFRKSFQPCLKGRAQRGNKVTRGEFGLQVLETSWISARQIEAARKTIVREIKRKGKLWITIFPHTPITNKSGEVGMGKGKGDVDKYIFPAKPGRVVFELGGVLEDVAKEAFRKAAQKLPIKCRFIVRSL